MKISVAIPNDVVDVSNGKFLSKTDLGDGYTRWDWQVHYPINSYNVSLNINDDEAWWKVIRDFYPVLELAFDAKAGTVAHRWNADESAFAMPIRAGERGKWQTIRPTTDWQIMKTDLGKDTFEVATDLYYVNVLKQ